MPQSKMATSKIHANPTVNLLGNVKGMAITEDSGYGSIRLYTTSAMSNGDCVKIGWTPTKLNIEKQENNVVTHNMEFTPSSIT